MQRGVTMLAQRLNELREQQELTQKDLARYINKTTQAYSYYERGEREPDIEALIKLADYFSITLDDLVGRPAFIEFSRTEIELIKKYRSLDEDGKGAVNNTIDFECKRAQRKSDRLSRKTIAG